MTRKYKKATPRKRLKKKLDDLFSMYIKLRDKRVRGICPFHAPKVIKPIEHCFHFLSRKADATRWDPKNAVGSCAGCNMAYNSEADVQKAVHDWYEHEWLGKKEWDRLVKRYHSTADFSMEDLVDIRIKLEDRIEQVCQDF